jgi:ATP-binding cassette subfamily C (CFTR/MRP) protein 1
VGAQEGSSAYSLRSLKCSLYISSGKSSLILTLLRLLDLQDGSITIDGIDITRVRLDILRQRCFITVSQDPLFLANETLRFNLDPDPSVSNANLISKLERTGLWSHFLQSGVISDESTAESFSVNGFISPSPDLILDTKLSSFPELSVGQEQLFALSRALVKAQSAQDSGRKPVVLLDEVTSSLDPTTESIIYGIIDEEFTKKGHTVICVSHRIEVLAKHTEPGRDVVVLLGNGRLQEVITDLSPMTLEKLGRLD